MLCPGNDFILEVLVKVTEIIAVTRHSVLGVPLVLLFNTIGLNPIIALAGMSVIWPLGDALPPTAIIGRLTSETIGMKEPYSKV